MDNSDGLFMAGDDLDRVWRSLRYWNHDTSGESMTALHRYGTGCSAQGCHRCTDPYCTYAEFIRQYWVHPHCD